MRKKFSALMALTLIAGLFAALTVSAPTASAGISCSYVKSTGKTQRVTMDHPVFGSGDKKVWVKGEVRYQDCKGAKGHRFVKVVSTFAGYNVEGTSMKCSGSSQILHKVEVNPYYWDDGGKSVNPTNITLPCNTSTWSEVVVKNRDKQRLYVCETREWPTWRFKVAVDGNGPKYGDETFTIAGRFPDTGEAGPFRHNC